MIAAERSTDGRPMARCRCDVCEAEDVFPVQHMRARSSAEPRVEEGKALKKAQSAGWTIIKNVLRCPACEAQRKESPMKDTIEAPREPSKEQKREIFAMLRDVYDTDNERYMQGDTDETVAAVLEVMPGWVAQIREELFGPAGGNEDMDALMVEIAALRDEVLDNIGAAKDMADRLTKNLERLKATEDALSKIKAAVGARVCRKAGVK